MKTIDMKNNVSIEDLLPPATNNDTNDDSDNNDKFEFVSNHTKSMRCALTYCINSMLNNDTGTTNNILSKSFHRYNKQDDDDDDDMTATKQLINDAFVYATTATTATTERILQETIPIVDTNNESMTPIQFRKEYLHANMPCLIRGLGTTYFSRIQEEWITTTNDLEINIEWFRTHIGNHTLVPVTFQKQNRRIDTTNNHSDTADEECLTIPTPLYKWLDNNNNNHDVSSVPLRLDSTAYLKDWHLLQQFNNNHHHDDETILPPPPKPLYTVPPFFQHDLLHSFCHDFIPHGDYQFVYWGPAGSKTLLHSDVLNSFSWSYNVIGEKRWTLVVPNTTTSSSTTTTSTIVVHQCAGETMFIPSTWKHEVENVVETLSINHNWITTANIHYTWDCLQTEMVAIQNELQKWSSTMVGTTTITTYDEQVQERMLHGCTGMDVTMFFLLCMTSLLKIVMKQEQNPTWETYFDIFRLGSMMEKVIMDQELNLHYRLKAVLESGSQANEAIHIAQTLLNQIHDLQMRLI